MHQKITCVIPNCNADLSFRIRVHPGPLCTDCAEKQTRVQVELPIAVQELLALALLVSSKMDTADRFAAIAVAEARVAELRKLEAFLMEKRP